MSSPTKVLEELAKQQAMALDSIEFAMHMDEVDPLRHMKQEFVHPKLGTIPRETIGDPDENCIYFLGNSLGLKPRAADRYMSELLDEWGRKGIFMHTSGRIPAAYADIPSKPLIARIVGAADPSEVVIMNGLTVNLHLMMLAFYKPNQTRNKIVIEDHAFPSDRYAVRSLMRLLNVTDDRLIMLKPRQGEVNLRTEDILDVLRKERENIALVMLPGIQYYTGQKLDMRAITRFAVEHNLPIGWDLAHAVGNVQLQLHDWGADFAVWCSYKYLNSGAGGISGAFFHKKHHLNPPTHLSGWWSNKQETRFEMREVLDDAVGAESFRLCNPPPWLTTLHHASLELFEKVGMDNIVKKQFLITGYLEYLIKLKLLGKVAILTSSDPTERGSQLSLAFSVDSTSLHGRLECRGVICDLRDKVVRVAPVPMYNTFTEVYRFVRILEEELA